MVDYLIQSGARELHEQAKTLGDESSIDLYKKMREATGKPENPCKAYS
ncbi:MAG: hypothetical protein V1870_02040 [Candidatus Aenigmatarchaeota archaeon]